jgi:DNA-binding helix-hairpin-helix protein with protein kinase domain
MEGRTDMAGMLGRTTTLHTASGDDVTLDGFIGAGGQGEVYRVRHRGLEKALKWYYPDSATAEQREIVEDLVARRFRDDRFLWPQALVAGDHGQFGYVMRIRPSNFAGLSEHFRREVNIKHRELLAACIHLVEAYRALHSQGIAYRDINQGNVFFDPATGDVLVCDNDNAIVEGRDAGIIGMVDFMAPELVRGDTGATPRTQTDLHSLAVLLFEILITQHPLKGALDYHIACIDDKAKIQLFGTDPVFVFDPVDSRNRPVAGQQDALQAGWDALPGSLRRLFTKAFTDGLHHPERRVRETQWRDAMSAARDMIAYCQRCDRQNIIDREQAGSQPCWKCQQALAAPLALEVTVAGAPVRRTILLARDARVFGHHLVASPARHDFTNTATVAAVTEHPRRRGRYGLKNLTTTAWEANLPGGESAEVPPGRSVDLGTGTRLRIGSNTAVMEPLTTAQ